MAKAAPSSWGEAEHRPGETALAHLWIASLLHIQLPLGNLAKVLGSVDAASG